MNPPGPTGSRMIGQMSSHSESLSRSRKAKSFSRKPIESKLYPPWLQEYRVLIYYLFEIPEYNWISRLIQVFILTCISISVTMLIYESYPSSLDHGEFLHNFEVIITILFTAEWSIRYWVCDVFGDTHRNFVRRWMNILDFLAVLPLYLEELLKHVMDLALLRVLRVTRLIRLFRLLRLGPFHVGIKLIFTTVTESIRTLLVLFLILAIVVVFFAAAIYYVERWKCPEDLITNWQYYIAYHQDCKTITPQGSLPRTSPYGSLLCCVVHGDAQHDPDNAVFAAKGFESIFASLWWSLVTVSTVGYGDFTPKTDAGHYVGMGVMMSGILILSLPVGIVGRKFHEAYNDLDRDAPPLKYYHRYREWVGRHSVELEKKELLDRWVENFENAGKTDSLAALAVKSRKKTVHKEKHEDKQPDISRPFDTSQKLLLQLLHHLDDRSAESEKRKKVAQKVMQKPGKTMKGLQAKKEKETARLEQLRIEKKHKDKLDANAAAREGNLMAALQAGVIPRGLKFPTVGAMSGNKRGAIRKLADRQNQGGANFFAQVLRRKEEDEVTSKANFKEYQMRDFEIIITNIRALMKFEKLLDDKRDKVVGQQNNNDKELSVLLDGLIRSRHEKENGPDENS